MSRKEPTREMKINRIIAHLEDMAETLDEVYIDDLLDIVQQYRALDMEMRKRRDAWA